MGERPDRLELLFSRASARSLDLKQLAGEATKLIPASSPKRRALMERLFGPNTRETVRGTSTRTVRGHSSNAELGKSLAGLEGAPYQAAMYSFGLDGTMRLPLFRVLRERVAEIARREDWPERIIGMSGMPHYYEDELTALVLDVDWWRPIFVLAQTEHNVNLYAIALDVPEEIWRLKLLPKYVRILQPFEAWKSIARSHVDRRLFEYMHRPGVAFPKTLQ
jgi:hypothetical protein